MARRRSEAKEERSSQGSVLSANSERAMVESLRDGLVGYGHPWPTPYVSDDAGPWHGVRA